MPFCAICTDETSDLVARPLGKDDALVSICRSCDEDRPATAVDGTRGYEFREGLPTRKEMDRGARLVMGDERYERDAAFEIRAGMSPTTTRIDEQDYIAFRMETVRRIRTKANDIKDRAGRRERKIY